MHHDLFVWAKKVPMDWIAKLYAADATLPDEELADRVVWALVARCDSIMTVTLGFERKRLPCPLCGETLQLTEGRFRCPCGFEASWEQFRSSYKNKQLYGANAMPVFRAFRNEFPKAETYREKMTAIDTLIHSFHLLHSWRLAASEEEQPVWTKETRPDLPLGRSTAVNLIEGSLTDVLRFLDKLSAAKDPDWRETLQCSNGYRGEWAKE